MKVILFGFTGLGNAVLRGLLNSEDVQVSSVYTKKYHSAYPYYNEIQMEEFCAMENITCHLGKRINSKDVIESLKHESPDLIFVASFNQIISTEVIDIPELGIINLHPSLLPKYRGPYPDQAVLLNNETETGISIHYITEMLDSGNILLQKKFEISTDEDYSSMKKKIAVFSEEMVPEVISLFRNGMKPEGTEQKETDSTFYPKPSADEGFLENESDTERIRTKVRALNPFPGTSVLVSGKRIEVDKFELLTSRKAKEGIFEEADFIDVYRSSSGIRLFKKSATDIKQ
jgi:methionyl-tRNA formyltransferase